MIEARLYRHRGGARIMWRAPGRGGATYSVVVAAGADAERVRAAVTVGLLTGQWSPLVAGLPAVRRWRRDRAAGAGAGEGDAVAEYVAVVRGEVTRQWARQTEATLRAAERAVGGDLSRATEAQVAGWLDGAKTVNTRNNWLRIVRKFYRWAGATRGWDDPAARLRLRTEARGELAISAWSAKERDRVLAVAAGVRRGVAVAIALLAGLRLNEVMRLTWGQVDLRRGVLVTQSKRGAARVVPLARRLEAALKAARPAGARDEERVVGAGLMGMRRICERMRRAGVADFGWQVCRHTFCSLLAQAGVSLDKICSWSGHTPEVCRRHYARFVPRDRRDRDIDRG